MILKLINEFEKIYIYWPSLHQDLYQKIIKEFSNYLPTNIILNILSEEVRKFIIEEIVTGENFEKSETEIESCESK